MEGSTRICPSCGKENPENARFCFACGATLAAGTQDISTAPAQTTPPPDLAAADVETETQVSQASEKPAQTFPKAAPQPAYIPPAPQGYPPAHSSPIAPPSRPSRRGRVRCCAIGCLVVLVVLLIGLPILHVTLLRPFIEKQIYNQVQKSLADIVKTGEYYGTDYETITERQLNNDAQDAWGYIPGSSEGHIYLLQDQIKIQLKFYGLLIWASADLRADNKGDFMVKSVKMNWLMNLIFSNGALKREIANFTNDKILNPNGLQLLAFQVTEGKLFIAYEQR